MKNKTLILGMTLSLILASTSIGFAGVGQADTTGGSNAVTTVTEVGARSYDDITMTSCKRINNKYARIVIKNNCSSRRAGMFSVHDAGTLKQLSSFDFSVPANQSKTYDVYVGSCNDIMFSSVDWGCIYKTI